jgi:hypothetical protein
MSILTVACLGFFIGHGLYWPTAAWTILLVSALIDGLLYIWVADVLVCYRCGAHYCGGSPGPTHLPFDLGIAERYRQERLRRQQLQAESKQSVKK